MGRKEGDAGNEVGRREQPGGGGGRPQPAEVSRSLLVGQHSEKTTAGYENDFPKRLSKQACHGSQGKGWLGSSTEHLQEHSWELRTFPQGTGGRHWMGLFPARDGQSLTVSIQGFVSVLSQSSAPPQLDLNPALCEIQGLLFQALPSRIFGISQPLLHPWLSV